MNNGIPYLSENFGIMQLTGNVQTTQRFEINYKEIMCVNGRIMITLFFFIRCTLIGIKHKKN